MARTKAEDQRGLEREWGWASEKRAPEHIMLVESRAANDIRTRLGLRHG